MPAGQLAHSVPFRNVAIGQVDEHSAAPLDENVAAPQVKQVDEAVALTPDENKPAAQLVHEGAPGTDR